MYVYRQKRWVNGQKLNRLGQTDMEMYFMDLGDVNRVRSEPTTSGGSGGGIYARGVLVGTVSMTRTATVLLRPDVEPSQGGVPSLLWNSNQPSVEKNDGQK